jgi:hypothetical protein
MRLSDGIQPTKTDRALATRKFFKALYKRAVETDRANATPEKTMRVIEQIAHEHDQRDVKADVEGVVVIAIHPRDLLYLGLDLMAILQGKTMLNELLIGEAMGNMNWHIRRKSIGIVVERSKWERWMRDVAPLLLLLSKKQKMSNKDYLACARAVIGLLRVELLKLSD